MPTTTTRIASGLGRGASLATQRAGLIRAGARLATRIAAKPHLAKTLNKAGQKAAKLALRANNRIANKPGVLQAVSDAIEAITELEQSASAALPPALKMRGLPALRVGDYGVGFPHAHNHPPNLNPPNPVPIAMPSVGPVISIPLLSGATRTFIENQAAARCGDLGVGVWCGGFFPMFEVFLGSSSVWTEGARQARQAVDVTKHCVFSSPRPSDAPLGMMFGMTMTGAKRTMVGGTPLPSFTSMVVGFGIKNAFRGVGTLVNRTHARLAVARFMSTTAVQGGPSVQTMIRNDLHRIARTRKGRQLMDELRRSGKALTIKTPDSNAAAARRFRDVGGDHCSRKFSPGDPGHVKFDYDPQGPYVVEMSDGSRAHVSVRGRGAGTSSEIIYDPEAWPRAEHSGSPSDVVLFHELNHSKNNAGGNNMAALEDPDPQWRKNWTNHEEKNTVAAENEYRGERGGVPKRSFYSDMP